MQNKAAKKASSAQQQASDAAIAEQRRQFDAFQANEAPFMQFGQNQLAGLGALNAGDYSGFENSPDYLYARDQALYGIDHSAAARGQLYSGGHSLDLAHELNGIASQNLGNYRGALQWGANLGQNAASGVGQAGMNSANQIGGYLQNAGDAQASGYLAQGNNNANLLNQLGQTASSYFGNRSAGTPTTYNPNTDPLAGSYTNGFGPGYTSTSDAWRWGG
jgi:hypothetical protein